MPIFYACNGLTEEKIDPEFEVKEIKVVLDDGQTFDITADQKGTLSIYITRNLNSVMQIIPVASNCIRIKEG